MDTGEQSDFQAMGCKNCLDGEGLDFDITMAYQPIIDAERRTIFAFEALVRGVQGQGAGEVLSWVDEGNRYAFDQTCRVKAIEIASKLGLADTDSLLSINFLPGAVYRAETCIRATIEAAKTFDFPASRIMFEVTEAEPVHDPDHLMDIFRTYQNKGFQTAIDDFGSGYAGLNLLSRFKPQFLKLDMQLCQGIAETPEKAIITDGAVKTAKALGIDVIAEGVETAADLNALRGIGVNLFQGYLFARPEIEALPQPDFGVF